MLLLHLRTQTNATANCFLLILCLTLRGEAARVRGFWDAESYQPVAAFAFHSTAQSVGYVYGNITTRQTSSPISPTSEATLVLLDDDIWSDHFSSFPDDDNGIPCSVMQRVFKNCREPQCLLDGAMAQPIPCAVGQPCEDTAYHLPLSGAQFALPVDKLNVPRLWHLSLVPCRCNQSQTSNCTWVNSTNGNGELSYNIWLVNGNPNVTQTDFLYYQLSYESQYVSIILLTYIILYLIFLSVLLCGHRGHSHTIIRVFLASILLEWFGLSLHFLHLAIYTFDGAGVLPVKQFGEVVDVVSQCMFMALLLLLGRGWTVTKVHVEHKAFLAVIVTYSLVDVGLTTARLITTDPVTTVDDSLSWQTLVVLGLRLFILLWFLYELHLSYLQEAQPSRQQFYVVLGGVYGLWFLYLPVAAVVVSQLVPPLWQYRTYTGITVTADFLSYAVLAYLLWPSRGVASYRYSRIPMDDDLSLLDYDSI
ncbi:TMEM145 [Branchiostoma lanceolatum]|uniref:TMEM145 protein n=1 Tax=Branchiostoma lanceolatum TaxID=7740 RepID=A0A8J9ZVG3_BRALA|nr:TMEM145 [Branchiostoma lanceolatum]